MSDCERTLRDSNLLMTMIVLNSLKIVLAPIGMLSLLRFAYRLFRRSKQTTPTVDEHSNSFTTRFKPSNNRLVAHSNMRILYANHLLASVLLAFFSLLTHINFVASLIIRHDPQCDVKYPAVLCIALNTPVHICTHAVALSLFALCIERTLATLFYRSYASVGSRVAKVIVPFQKKEMMKKNCLSRDRYQLDENVRCLRTILPTIIMHTICFFIPNAIALLLYLIVKPRKTEVVVIDLALSWLPYYGILLPIVVNRIGKRANTVQVEQMVKNVATGSVMQNNYFDGLAQAWK
ncbi:hypothetical protein PRIPAC_80725 [Pristionchus pacificus]|uniref:G protein-coupled receptor n=1 Tax=Pristionchus pacificus TaxID=54126 RepID=A0A2A6CLW9_PRIPA|nr:hypothetical protein PRIPAC_80725 [Pristionchus pacificus]|eukprot:PDM79067.1 G protein-coupled receptor [Pristionchus pacificus]